MKVPIGIARAQLLRIYAAAVSGGAIRVPRWRARLKAKSEGGGSAFLSDRRAAAGIRLIAVGKAAHGMAAEAVAAAGRAAARRSRDRAESRGRRRR